MNTPLLTAPPKESTYFTYDNQPPHIQATYNMLQACVQECRRANDFQEQILLRHAIKMTPQPGQIIVPLSYYETVLKPQNAHKASLKTIAIPKAIKNTLIVTASILVALTALYMLT